MPSVRSYSNANGTDAAPTAAKPSGLQVGDLLIAIVNANTGRDSGQSIAPSGTTWQQDLYPSTTEAQQSLSVWVGSRYVDGSEPANLAFTLGSAGRWDLTILCVQDVDQTNRYDVAGSAPLTAASSTPTAPSLTTTIDNSLHVAMGCADTSANTFTGYPSGYTVVHNGTSGQQPTAVAVKAISPAGATGAQAFTTVSTEGQMGMSLAVRAAAAAAGNPWYAYAQQ